MRKEAKYSVTWDLDSIYSHPETKRFAKELASYKSELEKVAQQSDKLPPVDAEPKHVAEWVRFLRATEKVLALATSLTAFVECHSADDAANRALMQIVGQLSALDPLREKIGTNIEFALKGADDATFEEFLAADKPLREIEFFLRERRKNADLRLPRDMELLSADLSVDAIHAWGRLYNRLSGVLKITVMEKGELVSKSPGQVLFDSPDRSLRQNNFFAANKAWEGISDSCSEALNHISGFRLTRYRWLGLKDHLEAPLRINRMERKTLDAMWATVSKRKKVLLGYLKKKAERLGLEKLSWYDLQAPFPSAEETPQSQEISYDLGSDTIIRTFQKFSPDFGKFARHAIENRWIEAENRSGKRQGGFCTDLPLQQQSRIFMTYLNTRDSMSTLAHELGHAYHSHVLRSRPFFLRDYPMNLAETASTFGEAVLNEQQLAVCATDGERLQLLESMLADAVAFLMNIHARFLFEDRFHVERLEGELTAARFSDLMLEAQKKAYLGALDDDGWNPLFWASKLHFYISEIPFYNFPYTFGYLLSLGLYSIAAQGKHADFPKKYREFLVATGSMTAEDSIASTFGYDLRQEEFWNLALDVVDERVERFLKLAQ